MKNPLKDFLHKDKRRSEEEIKARIAKLLDAIPNHQQDTNSKNGIDKTILLAVAIRELEWSLGERINEQTF